MLKMGKPNKKKPDVPQRRTLQRLPEEEELTTILVKTGVTIICDSGAIIYEHPDVARK